LVTGSYLTLYRISGKVVEIIRVMHGKRAIDEKDVS
jgi:plasmid stabilization system protein ParE